MLVGSAGMLMGNLAMFECRCCVFLCLFVFAELVMMGRLKVMMCRGMVMRGSLKVMLTRRMFRCLRHLLLPSCKMEASPG
jgi:hypothetical protein